MTFLATGYDAPGGSTSFAVPHDTATGTVLVVVIIHAHDNNLLEISGPTYALTPMTSLGQMATAAGTGHTQVGAWSIVPPTEGSADIELSFTQAIRAAHMSVLEFGGAAAPGISDYATAQATSTTNLVAQATLSRTGIVVAAFAARGGVTGMAMDAANVDGTGIINGALGDVSWWLGHQRVSGPSMYAVTATHQSSATDMAGIIFNVY